MLKKKVTVINASGIHARPASMLVKTAAKYQSEFHIHSHGYRINAKSILGVLTLAAECGAELLLEFNGEDEQEACEAIVRLFEEGFGMMEEDD
ncbi:phosphocarrier protein [Cyclonatronum proteinivorum]|uniref:Phosphocarrier protein n=1 Tax=Cyclonatronum proteinivorum TaxID=1457365 RepID=A0A345UNA1_9BACT|nr:HPr family phosphocarrier protein [Cyclonatronum proteinivorum]AXJ01953.1 phosphocarrier protein [Cyclonatronum proteinivorum]